MLDEERKIKTMVCESPNVMAAVSSPA